MGQTTKLNREQVASILREQDLVFKLREMAISSGYTVIAFGSEDSYYDRAILSISNILSFELGNYVSAIEQKFGGPLKWFDEGVAVEKTVPALYVPFLNRMNGSRLLTELLNSGRMSPDELALRVSLHNHMASHPQDTSTDFPVIDQPIIPINLTDAQCLYGRNFARAYSKDSNGRTYSEVPGFFDNVELIRITPDRTTIPRDNYFTLEYMICRKKGNDAANSSSTSKPAGNIVKMSAHKRG